MGKISFLKKIDVKVKGWLPQLDDSSSSHYIASNSNANIYRRNITYISLCFILPQSRHHVVGQEENSNVLEIRTPLLPLTALSLIT